MATLRERIEQDFMIALKAREEKKLNILRLLRSAIKNASIAAKDAIDDVEVEKVTRQQVKQLLDALDDFQKAARQDLVEKTKEEIAMLKQYLPAELSTEAITEKVETVVAQLKKAGAVTFPQAMQEAMKELKGKADGKAIAEAVKKALA